jgi:hypothetical protein
MNVCAVLLVMKQNAQVRRKRAIEPKEKEFEDRRPKVRPGRVEVTGFELNDGY